MNILTKISIVLIVAVLAANFAFAQKDESRLNIGQSPKKTVVANNLLAKNSSLSKGISFNSKNNYTQFYRNLLLNKSSKSTEARVVVSQVQENAVDKITLSNIYPNPANDYAYIDYTVNGNFTAANVSFFNLLGKQLAEYPLSKSNDKLRINTSSWESGIYMYQLIIDGKKIATKKLLVRHN